MSKTPETLYHYTVGSKLEQIEKARRLEPRGYGMAASRREKPVLWWSANPLWEPTANKVVSRDGKNFYRPALRELQEMVGVYRYALDCRKPDGLNATGIKLIPWSRIPLIAKIDPVDIASMLRSAQTLGSTPTHWWGTLDPVPLSLQVTGLLRLETLDVSGPGEPTSWTPISMADAMQRFQALGNRIISSTATATPAARGI